MKSNTLSKIKYIELSSGVNESQRTIQLDAARPHLEKINAFIANAKINKTIPLRQYLQAHHIGDKELLEKVARDAPNRELPPGATVFHLSFYFEKGEPIVLKDVNLNIELTHFTQDFKPYMEEKGRPSKTPEVTQPKAQEQIYKYSDKDLIVELQLTPGMPNTISYQIQIYGDGRFEYNGPPSRGPKPVSVLTKQPSEIDPATIRKNGTTLSKNEVETILTKAENINFIKLTSSPTVRPHVHDGQQTLLSIWQKGGLRKASFGPGNYMNEETEALADYILSLVGG